MSSIKRRAQWWQLYFGLPVLLGLFLPEMRASLTETEHIIAELGILFLVFGFTQLWLRANRSALMNMEQQEAGWVPRFRLMPPKQFHASADRQASAERMPVRRISAVEIKGVLSDTFEWDASEDDSSVFADRSVVLRKE
jgi:hypothetical protein